MSGSCGRVNINLSNKIHNYNNIIVAVSGGSDSLALLNILNQNKINISAVTINHRLRNEAKNEAKYVRKICEDIGVRHVTLKPKNIPKNAEQARQIRYELLVKHAKKISADAIALGHTMDDQAETIIMRAKRVNKNSDTRGLSAMSEVTTHNNVDLVRPLLKYTRKQLKNFLKKNNVKWVNDPSNQNKKSERVRVRQKLAQQKTEIQNIAKLAELCGRSRKWLNQQTATFLERNVTKNKNSFILKITEKMPEPITTEIFGCLILITGKTQFRTQKTKLNNVVKTFQKSQKSKMTVGHTIVETNELTAKFTPENRNNNRKITDATKRFRTEYDNPIFEAIQNIQTKQTSFGKKT